MDDTPMGLTPDEEADYWANGDYIDDQPDEFQEAVDNCYMTPDGWCGAAGSEYCDWDCPFARDDPIFVPEDEFDGDPCPNCLSKATERVVCISEEPEIWHCECGACGNGFEVTVSSRTDE